MKLFFLTGPEYPTGHPDDQKLMTMARERAEARWLNWREVTRGGSFSVGGRRDGVTDATVLIRTPWDYHTDPEAFLNVLHEVESAGARLVNSAATVRWNLDKIYLTEIGANGVDIVPTFAFAQGVEGLPEFRRRHGPGPWILKPRIGASASGVRIIDSDELDRIVFSGEALTTPLSHIEGRREVGAPVSSSLSTLLLQPVIESVRTDGEVSLIFYRIDDEPVFSHAVVKRPRGGDFRVQTDWGGTEAAFAASPELIATGRRWLEKMDREWLYARVDLLDFATESPLLGEMELIEPQLFHRFGTRSEELLLRALSV